jgi:hypothetical protein
VAVHYLIRLSAANCESVDEMQDVFGFVDNALIPHSQGHSGVSRHIDPYGKTSFNGIQCEVLLDELNALSNENLDQQYVETLHQLIGLTKRAIEEAHLHVVFYGD